MCAHGALAANSTSKLMVQNLLQLSMCFFMHVSEMEHSSSAITAYLQPPLHLMTESDNYMHTMADIVFPLVDIIYHYSIICLWKSLYCCITIIVFIYDMISSHTIQLCFTMHSMDDVFADHTPVHTFLSVCVCVSIEFN